ncbi:glycoside hydrolase family 3 protein [Thermodesulfobacteriota bacterium]
MIATACNPTLDEKIGQLIAIGFHGASPGDEGVRRVTRQVKAGKVSGVVIYRYNIKGPRQLNSLLKPIHDASGPLPLFVMIDQEGGRVQRLHGQNGFFDTLSAKRVASEMDVAEAQRHYDKMGAMLKKTGFNINLAPCVDLGDDPPSEAIGQLERSYSSDPQTISDYAEAMVEGLRVHGVLSCLKHFPGHGRARGDSHMGLVDITKTWLADELWPYRKLISRGAADAVMTAHLIHNQVDPDTPATLSTTWINRLRTDIGFDGVVVADDLHMGAIIRRYSLGDVLIKGLNAGLDLFLFSNNPLAEKTQGIRQDSNSPVVTTGKGGWSVPDPDLPEKIIRTVKKAVSDGSIDPSVIDRAYNRVVHLKQRLFIC